MTHDEVVSHLSRLIDSPASEPLYSITMHHVVQQIAHRMGESALSLSADDLQLARTEALSVLQHRMDHRPYLEEALDCWDLVRQL
ncbi:MAG: hypothetical protein AB7T17_00220 [Geobacter sp.]